MKDDGSHFLSWFELAQVRRRVPAKRRDGWEQMGSPVPLARAVRDALVLMAREPVSIMIVRARAGACRLDDRDIMRLSQRMDYPYRPGEEEEVGRVVSTRA